MQIHPFLLLGLHSGALEQEGGCPVGAETWERVLVGWWWDDGGMVVTITPSQAPTASSAICPGQKMLLAEFPFLCTLSPSLPMAASQGASTAGLTNIAFV